MDVQAAFQVNSDQMERFTSPETTPHYQYPKALSPPSLFTNYQSTILKEAKPEWSIFPTSVSPENFPVLRGVSPELGLNNPSRSIAGHYAHTHSCSNVERSILPWCSPLKSNSYDAAGFVSSNLTVGENAISINTTRTGSTDYLDGYEDMPQLLSASPKPEMFVHPISEFPISPTGEHATPTTLNEASGLPRECETPDQLIDFFLKEIFQTPMTISNSELSSSDQIQHIQFNSRTTGNSIQPQFRLTTQDLAALEKTKTQESLPAIKTKQKKPPVVKKKKASQKDRKTPLQPIPEEPNLMDIASHETVHLYARVEDVKFVEKKPIIKV
ncbi:hypothetical protein HDV06_003442 [Boothiomyces sp. JEL0866]|nr:hypothetical protein HDV06_003442 [Boothiomyces sp. JEL0866]